MGPWCGWLAFIKVIRASYNVEYVQINTDGMWHNTAHAKRYWWLATHYLGQKTEDRKLLHDVTFKYS